jgi:hypothetical protein
MRELADVHVREAGELHRVVPGRRDRPERAGQIGRGQAADRVELERDLVGSHPATVRHPAREIAVRERFGIA